MPVEYRIIELFSRDAGRRSDKFTLYAFPKDGGWPYDSGHRELDFDCLRSRSVSLAVCDVDGRGCVASCHKDRQDRVYPHRQCGARISISSRKSTAATARPFLLPDGEYTGEASAALNTCAVSDFRIDASHRASSGTATLDGSCNGAGIQVTPISMPGVVHITRVRPKVLHPKP
jgi:hypothetical protein